MSGTPAEQLSQLLGKPRSEVDLGRAALVLAQLEYPDLDPDPYRKKLAAFARSIRSRLSHHASPPSTISAINRCLFEEQGFHGNEADYYDPRNSFLNDVIDRRTGIPITLCVVYLEIARRLELPVFGVGLPGHFIVKYDDGDDIFYIDPFHQGQLLEGKGCRHLVASVLGTATELTDTDFAAVDERYIILRMLNNLRGIYLNTVQHRKALLTQKAILALSPASAEEVKLRGKLNFQLRHYGQARKDFETYLSLRPRAEDAAEVKQNIEEIAKILAMMN